MITKPAQLLGFMLLATRAGAVAAQAERLELAQYAHLDSSNFFVPFAVEISAVLGEATEDFVRELGRRLCKATREPLS